jgi:hypothetical protein
MGPMLRHKAKRLFDPAKPVYARRELVVGEKVYQIGDLVMVDGVEIPLGLAQTWFRLRFIGHESLEASPAAAPVEAPKAEPPAEPAVEAAATPAPPAWTSAKKQKR